MTKEKEIEEKDEFGRITCPQCKGKYYYIKGEICSACLFINKKSSNKKEYEDNIFLAGQNSQKEKDLEMIEINPERFHDIYEEEADRVGWETNRNCRVKFDSLPELNQETMIRTCERIKKELQQKINGEK